MPLAARMGITRIAVLTGLDSIGIPVVAAVRPNSRSIAVHQGKGATLAAAKASAVMEAVETYHAENITLPLRLASFDELVGGGVRPHACRLRRWAALGTCGRRHERLLWVDGPGTDGGGAALGAV